MSIKRLQKLLRVVSIPPVMALIMFTLLYLLHPDYFGSTLAYILTIIFIVAFPVMAYPIQPIVPGYRNRGREGQRSLAMLMSSIGYCLGIISAVIIDATFEVWVIFLTYFISGLLIFIFNKLLKIRASGHACGVAGPIFALIYFLGPWALIGLLFLAAIYWASLRMKRHSKSELLIGTAIPAFALMMSFLIASAIK